MLCSARVSAPTFFKSMAMRMRHGLCELSEPMCSNIGEPMCSNIGEPMCSNIGEPMCLTSANRGV